jgi:hypothetical protein
VGRRRHLRVSRIRAPTKRLLTTDEAAEYCGLGRESFLSNCPVRPKRVRSGQRGLRYDVCDLDDWIDALAFQGEDEARKTTDQWLATLDAAH